jgi:hypothetical protein
MRKLLLAGSGERAAVTLTRVAGYRRPPGEDNDAQLFAQSRTLRNDTYEKSRGEGGPIRFFFLCP